MITTILIYIFLYSEENPEVFLVKAYHQKNPNANLSYHIENSDNHCLFGKLVELGVCQDTDKAFELCWDAFISTNEGKQYLEELEEFLIQNNKRRCTILFIIRWGNVKIYLLRCLFSYILTDFGKRENVLQFFSLIC